MNFLLEDLKNDNEILFFNALKKIQKNSLSTSIIVKKIVQGNKKYLFDYNLYPSKEEVLVSNNKIVNKKDFLVNDELAINYTILCILALKYESLNEYEEFMKDYLGNIKEVENKVIFMELLDKMPTQVISIKGELKPVINFEKLEITFKLIIIKEYNIFDLHKFYDYILRKKDAIYGKKTVFNHDIKNFDDFSQNLINLFLDNVFNIKEDKTAIKLTPLMIDRLFNLYHNRVLTTDTNKKYFCMLEEKQLDISLINNVISLDVDNSQLIKGYKYVYMIKDNLIYKVSYPDKNEVKVIFDYLVNKDISLDYVEEDFVNKIFYDIKDHINVEESFIKKYPISKNNIDSYFYLQNDNIVLDSKVYIDEEEVKIKEREPLSIVNTSNKEITNHYFLNKTKNYFQNIESLGFKYEAKANKYIIEKLEDVLNFTKYDLEKLKDYGDVFISKEIKDKKSISLPKINIKVTQKVDLLSFKIVNTDLTINEIKEIIYSYKKKQKFVKLRNTILEIDDSVSDFVNIIDDFNLDIDKLFLEEEKPYSHILKFLNDKNDLFIVDQIIEDVIYDLKNYKKATFKVPTSFEKIMRSYQIEAFLWMKTLIKYNFGGILADDMGLGKTLEMISVISSDEVLKPTLVVCPTSLIYNWKSEINTWDSNLEVKTITGSQTFRKEMIENISINDKIIYITSYDTLKKDIIWYNKKMFRMVIADEGQFIKNKHTQKSEAIKTLNSDIKFCLTGTPIENSLADLWSLFDFVMPGYLSSYNNFKSRYETLIENDDKHTLNQLILRVMPFVLRRTKKQVLKDLPDKHELVYQVKLNEEQQKLYDGYYLDAVNNLETKNTISILTLLTRLRQICVEPSLFLEDYNQGSTKIDLCIELLVKFVNLGHKILLFSQFPSVFQVLEEKLKIQDVKSLTLTGKTKSENRLNLVNEFNNNEDIKVFLISLKAGGTGLNLTSANIVIHLDPWWNTSVENQASDRVYRIGQTKKVQIVKIICANTIEEKVIKLQKLKESLANSVIDNELTLEKLSKEDIKYIFE